MRKKILFVIHEASLAGSPLLLLRFLKWLKAKTDTPFQVLIVNETDWGMEREFEAVAPTYVFNRRTPYPPTLIRKIWDFRVKKAAHSFNIKKSMAGSDIGLIYFVTPYGDMMEYLSFLKAPVIYHVQEMAYMLTESPKNLEKVRLYTDRYIAASNAVRKGLVDMCGVPDSKIDVIYNFVPIESVKARLTRSEVCKETGIPVDAAIICGSGLAEWYKSLDMFVRLAHIMRNRSARPVYFMWLGAGKEDRQIKHLRAIGYDVGKLGLEGRVRFLGDRPNPFDYFAACDVFVCPSRIESFSLVCVEAASLGKPVVCFKDAGGPEEFVGSGAGFVVPYLDADAMAAKVMELLDSPELRERIGKQAKEKARDYDIELIAPKLLEAIGRALR